LSTQPKNSPDTQHFSILEHSGDLKLEASGSDYLEALASGVAGLMSLIVDPDSVEEREQMPVTLQGDDETSRTIGFLNEIIFLVYAKHWLPTRIKQLRLCSSKACDTLEALIAGEPFDPLRHLLKLDVKAVTYHMFSIKEQSGRCTIRFVCDL
jgi:SHS2 domain-containing protein